VWIVIGTIAIVLATVSAGVLLDRRFGLLPRKQLPAGPRHSLPGHAEGEAAATAILVSVGELERLRRRKCPSCTTLMDVGAESAVQYEGRELRVLSFRCPQCQKHQALYVELR
jgi:hypothetical protein